MYLANVAAFAKYITDEIIATIDDGKNLKYEYQTNTNMLIGKQKTNLPALCSRMQAKLSVANYKLCEIQICKISRFKRQ
jgi:hypothetical protein